MKPVIEAGTGLSEEEQQELLKGFDAGFYLERYPDIREAGLDPFQHFMEHGWREGRDPRPDFVTRFYLDANPDIEASGTNPFEHWWLHGRAEGRVRIAVPGAGAPTATRSRTPRGSEST